jgi:hypothetical protein
MAHLLGGIRATLGLQSLLVLRILSQLGHQSGLSCLHRCLFLLLCPPHGERRPLLFLLLCFPRLVLVLLLLLLFSDVRETVELDFGAAPARP